MNGCSCKLSVEMNMCCLRMLFFNAAKALERMNKEDKIREKNKK